MPKSELDYEIIHNAEEGQFQVWTPDTTGACIGSGGTKESALQDAIVTMALTIANMMGATKDEI